MKLAQDDRQGKRDSKPRFSSRSLVTSTSTISCYHCKKDHSIYVCEDFLKLSVKKRIDFVNRAKLCQNCLRQHPPKRCRGGTCRKCQLWHNTLLHEDKGESVSQGQNADNSSYETPQVEPVLTSTVSKSSKRVTLLSTARVQVLDKFGIPHTVRALLDSGSMSSFITKNLCDTLGLDTFDANLNIFGISNSLTKVRNKCQIDLSSLYTNFKTKLMCFILPEITNVTPGFEINLESLNIPHNLHLADETFNRPGAVELLIGCDLFWSLLKTGRLSGGKYSPTIQETELGWIVAGPMGEIETREQEKDVCCNLSTNQELHDLVSKFWEVEEVNQVKPLSNEETECEKIFIETTTRNHEGRFIVNLAMFYNLEKRLLKNESLRVQYIKFMQEYLSLNHMTIADSSYVPGGVQYFMPHHGVLRQDSLTTKLRVVFNASSPSSNGISLNNIQFIGPVLQDDLLSMLLRFREKRYVISADCKMMYRQVLINPEQRKLQQILWRENPTEQLKTYMLNTVTYGQASASYLAIRCLFQLANECADSLPKVANVIRRSFYVDDLLFSSESIEHARYICREITRILRSGCFELRKWYSNDPRVLDGIETEDKSCGILTFGPHETTKTLGLTWSCYNDQLAFCIDINNYKTDTKRSVLSLTARIFDPLGMLSPCTILAKIFMQKLWSKKLPWDETLPVDLSGQWAKFKNELPFLNQLTIERHVVCQEPQLIELHGFADASERAYGACLYVRSIDKNNQVFVNLLCSKSKVAPIKTLTIPRLELCAALLLARLVKKVTTSLTIKIDKFVYWSDSSIVLAWIKTSANLLKTFVGTRIAIIQNLTNDQDWRHVPTQENPADHLSRGLYDNQILEMDMWWYGPKFLKAPPAEWPTSLSKLDTVPELKPFSTTVLPTIKIEEFPFERFSQFSRLIHVTAYILRFKNNCLKPISDRIQGPLLIQEINLAKKYLIKVAQRQSFPYEFSCLIEKRSIDSKSKILNLTPFLDSDKIIRVGGRLEFSNFLPDKKHPILLHSSHPFTKLFFAYQHLKLLHVGPQALLSSIRDEFWPISGRNLARSTVKRCIRCFRVKPDFVQPIMANLPRDRTVPSPPFHVTGLDYASPFLVRSGFGRSRSCKLEKCYISVFVCFTTKALHLELVSSLTSSSFILALRRFISRRGKPSKIVSDNGTTFVGAHRELKDFLKSHQHELKGTAVSEGIDWQFICPYSPHMGGLWESGVKSVKHHLKRVLANAHLTFEEFSTTLSQIEAILNSRPLCPLSSEPNDLVPLTPAHFLIGRPLTAAPDENLDDVKLNRLSRFQLVQRICQHFWRRWQQDYLSELQQRQK
ncbi:uncharacterized protein LOC126749190 [Anthonomus grandis grandis]|uniref:uncharacterized protein LOC126749190 n=1 Tax=Anthonomus grandis grandis TaxID=2921223 RepID=UPI0021665715|nr:uncharacterized protein LOC126749190 [Anthonomus grandis grandis]